MQHNDYGSLSSPPRRLLLVSIGRTVQAAVCAAVFCLPLVNPPSAQAQSTDSGTQTAAQTKKKKKKSVPPKTAPTKEMEAAARIVVVFPPETKGGVSDQIADTISDVVQSRLTLTGKYKTVYFLPSSPTIRRGILDRSLTQEEVDKPVATDTRIKKLTEMTGHDMAVVVSIIDYQFDKATNKVSMVLSAKVLDYTGAPPHGTNRNGDSPDKPSPKATEYDLASALARDLTEKMMTDLLTPTKPTAADADKK